LKGLEMPAGVAQKLYGLILRWLAALGARPDLSKPFKAQFGSREMRIQETKSVTSAIAELLGLYIILAAGTKI
jgi:hypothetical protein